MSVEKTQEAIIVKRQVSHRVVCAGRIRADQHGLCRGRRRRATDRGVEREPVGCFFEQDVFGLSGHRRFFFLGNELLLLVVVAFLGRSLVWGTKLLRI